METYDYWLCPANLGQCWNGRASTDNQREATGLGTSNWPLRIADHGGGRFVDLEVTPARTSDAVNDAIC